SQLSQNFSCPFEVLQKPTVDSGLVVSRLLTLAFLISRCHKSVIYACHCYKMNGTQTAASLNRCLIWNHRILIPMKNEDWLADIAQSDIGSNDRHLLHKTNSYVKFFVKVQPPGFPERTKTLIVKDFPGPFSLRV